MDDEDITLQASDDRPELDLGFLKQLITSHFEDTKTKINEPALQLSNEMIRMFVLEAIQRATAYARKDNPDIETVEPQHILAILPGLWLDF